MSVYDQTLDGIIDRALTILFEKKSDIYTFALYYDHESHAVSACADTMENSARVTHEMNAFSRAQFFAAIQQGDLERAALWNFHTGRSFALGEFQFRSLGWTPLRVPNNSAPFYRALVAALIRNSNKIAALTRNPEALVLCCSSKKNDIGLIWGHESG